MTSTLLLLSCWQKRRRTDVFEFTDVALGFARITHPASMKDETQTELAPFGWWEMTIQNFLHFHGVFFHGQTQTPRESTNVSVDGETRQIKHDTTKNVACLSPNAGQRDEIIKV
jgi:hypothetical protein